MLSEVYRFAAAVLAGFVVAMPVGAIGAMCLRRAIQGLWLDGLFTGIGAALADAALAATAMLGLTLLSHYILDNGEPLRLIGGVVLLYLGVRMIRTRHMHLEGETMALDVPTRGWRWWLGDFATGFGLTIINPATLLAFAGVLAGFGLFAGHTRALLANWPVLIGVFCGSMLWWIVLIVAASAMRRHAPSYVVSAANAGLGAMVMVFGVISIASLWWPLGI